MLLYRYYQSLIKLEFLLSLKMCSRIKKEQNWIVELLCIWWILFQFPPVSTVCNVFILWCTQWCTSTWARFDKYHDIIANDNNDELVNTYFLWVWPIGGPCHVSCFMLFSFASSLIDSTKLSYYYHSHKNTKPSWTIYNAINGQSNSIFFENLHICQICQYQLLEDKKKTWQERYV